MGSSGARSQNVAKHPNETPLLSTSGRQKTPALFQKRRSKIGPCKLLKLLVRFLISLGVRRGGCAQKEKWRSFLGRAQKGEAPEPNQDNLWIVSSVSRVRWRYRLATPPL